MNSASVPDPRDDEGLIEFYGGPWDGQVRAWPLANPDIVMSQSSGDEHVTSCMYRDTGLKKHVGDAQPIRIFKAARGGNFAGPPPLPPRET